MKRVGIALCAALVAVAAGCGPSPHHVASSKTSPRGALDSGSPGAPAATGLAPATGTSGSATSVPVSDPSVPTTATTLAGTGGGGGGGGVATGPIPKVITVAYVDAVFAQLDAKYGDALRSAVAAGKVTATSVRDLYAVLAPSLVPLATKALGILQSKHFEDVQGHPGNQHTEVLHVYFASQNCIFLRVRVNYSAVDMRAPASSYSQFEELGRATAINILDGDPSRWAIFYDNVVRQDASVTNQCLIGG